MNRKIDIKNRLLFAAPEIAAEWDEILNGDLKPENVSKWSVNKAWWKCKNGHVWEAYINNRTKRNDGCPYCNGRYATKEDSLEALYPEVALDWHSTKNKELTPDKVKPFSNKKVWWKCRNNSKHEWQAIVGSKVKSVAVDSNGCPYCTGKKANEDYNLEVIEPILASEWHSTMNKKLSPRDVTPSSNKKVWWKCKVCNHEWEATINNRNSKNNKRGCPICQRGHQTSFPEQAVLYYMNRVFESVENGKELICGEKVFKIDVYIPEINLAIEYDGEYAHKNKIERDHEKSNAILNNGMKLIRIREPKLPRFETRNVEVLYRNDSNSNSSLKIVIDEVLNWIIKSNPSKALVHKVNKLKEEDFSQHLLTIENEVKINRKENSLAFTQPAIAKQWHETKNLSLSPWNYTEKSSKTVWWQCEKGHEYKAAIIDKSENCLVCTNKVVHISNCLATTHPILAKEWHPTKNRNLTPYDIVAGTSKLVWWLCTVCDYEWRTPAAKRRGSSRTGGTKCPSCSNKVVTKGNCLAVTSPKLAKEWHPTKNDLLTPKDVTAGSDKRAWWLCQTCQNEWDAPIYHRKKTGCPLCSNRRMAKRMLKSNDEFIKEIKDLVGDEYIPQEEYKGATTYIKFLHVACGNVLSTSPSKFKSAGRRCKCRGK